MSDNEHRSTEAGPALPEWEDFIEADPEILAGKPVVTGTRISVEHLLGLLASGWSEEQILDAYPSVSRDAMRAIYAFSAEVVSEQRLFGVPLPARKARASAALPRR